MSKKKINTATNSRGDQRSQITVTVTVIVDRYPFAVVTHEVLETYASPSKTTTT